MILKSGILLLVVLCVVESFPFNFGYHRQPLVQVPQYAPIALPSQLYPSLAETNFKLNTNNYDNQRHHQPQASQPLSQFSRFSQGAPKEGQPLSQPLISAPMIPVRAPQPYYGSSQYQAQPSVNWQAQVPMQQHQVKSAEQIAAEKDFLASLQIIDTQGRLRDLRDFGIGSVGGQIHEPELERQLISIFETINKDLAQAQFLPLEVDGSQHQLSGLVDRPEIRELPLSYQPFGVQSHQHQPGKINQPVISLAPPAQYQYLRPNRLNRVADQYLKSPAQALRDDKRSEAEVRRPQAEVSMPIQTADRNQQVYSNQQAQIGPQAALPVLSEKPRIFETKGQRKPPEAPKESQRVEQVSSGKSLGPAVQAKAAAPVEIDRKPIQEQTPNVEQQQQQQGFDDELAITKEVKQSRLPQEEPLFSRPTPIEAKQSRTEQAAIENIQVEQAPIVQEPALQSRVQPIHQSGQSQYEGALFTPFTQVAKFDGQKSKSWVPILPGKPLIEQQQQLKAIEGQQVIEQTREGSLQSEAQKPISQLNEFVEEQRPLSPIQQLKESHEEQFKQIDSLQKELPSRQLQQQVSPLAFRGVRLNKSYKSIGRTVSSEKSKLVPISDGFRDQVENFSQIKVNPIQLQHQEPFFQSIQENQQQKEEIPNPPLGLQQLRAEEVIGQILEQQRQDDINQEKDVDVSSGSRQGAEEQQKSVQIEDADKQVTTSIPITTNKPAVRTEPPKSRRVTPQIGSKARTPAQKMREQQSKLAQQQRKQQAIDTNQQRIVPQPIAFKKSIATTSLPVENSNDEDKVSNRPAEEPKEIKVPSRKLQIAQQDKKPLIPVQLEPIAPQTIRLEQQNQEVAPQEQTEFAQQNEFKQEDIQEKQEEASTRAVEPFNQNREQPIEQQQPLMHKEETLPAKQDEESIQPVQREEPQQQKMQQREETFQQPEEVTQQQLRQQPREEISSTKSDLVQDNRDPASGEIAQAQPEMGTQAEENQQTSVEPQNVQNLESVQPVDQPQMKDDKSQELRQDIQHPNQEENIQQMQESTTSASTAAQQQQEITPQLLETTSQTNEEQDGQQQQLQPVEQIAQGPKKVDDSLMKQSDEQQSQEKQANLEGSQIPEIKSEDEPSSTTTQRPPTRIVRPNIRKSAIRFGAKHRTSAEAEQNAGASDNGSIPRNSSRQPALFRKFKSRTNGNEQQKQVSSNEGGQNGPEKSGEQAYLSAHQLLKTYNPLQFEPERISSLNRASGSSDQNTNVNSPLNSESY